LKTGLLVAHSVHQADDGSSAVEAADHLARAVEHQRRQMAGVGVGELRGGHVVVGEEERGVLFRLRAAIEVAVKQEEDAGRAIRRACRVSGEVFAAGGEGCDGALAVDQVLAGEAVARTAECRVAISRAAEIPLPLMSPSAMPTPDSGPCDPSGVSG